MSIGLKIVIGIIACVVGITAGFLVGRYKK